MCIFTGACTRVIPSGGTRQWSWLGPPLRPSTYALTIEREHTHNLILSKRASAASAAADFYFLFPLHFTQQHYNFIKSQHTESVRLQPGTRRVTYIVSNNFINQSSH